MHEWPFFLDPQSRFEARSFGYFMPFCVSVLTDGRQGQEIERGTTYRFLKLKLGNILKLWDVKE